MAKFNLLKDQIYLGLSEHCLIQTLHSTLITLENNSKRKINVSRADMDMYLILATENMNNF